MNLNVKDFGKELANRLAGAAHSRRIYAAGSPVWQSTLETLHQEISGYFKSAEESASLTVALLGEGLAVCGQPILNPPPPVLRLTAQMKSKDVEIISLERETSLSEIEALLSFLSADAAEVAAVKGSVWLRERGVEHIQIKHLKWTAGSSGVSSFRDVFRMGSQTLGQQFGRARSAGTVDMGPLIDLSRGLMDLIGSDVPVATLLALRERDDYSYVHSMNVALLAGCQAQALGLAKAEVEEISLAGLLHDIGKTRVPDGILTKRSALSTAEQAQLNAHNVEGARIVMSSQGADRLAAIVTMEHHRPANANPMPLLATQLVAIADAFDSIRTLRPFDQRHHLQGALAFMADKLKDRLSPYLVSRFATLCGYVKAGEMTKLASQEVCKVVAVHPESAWHPTLEVVDTALGAFPVGTRIDLAKPQPQTIKAVWRLAHSEHFATLTVDELNWLG